MELNEYQKKAMTTCMESCDNFSYMMLNLVGEVGEFASKVAKQIRKGNVVIGIDTDDKECQLCAVRDYERVPSTKKLDYDLVLEAGDILWQLAGLCKVMDWKLEDVAQMNLAKLELRKQAGTIDGSGDGIIRDK